MNRIYKTIWSEVHHTCIAVSEITKRKGKNSVRTSSSRRILALSCALALTLGGIAGNAANTASGDNATAFGIGNTASGKASLAIGQGTKATGDNSIAGGYWTHAVGMNTVALGNNTVAGIKRNEDGSYNLNNQKVDSDKYPVYVDEKGKTYTGLDRWKHESLVLKANDGSTVIHCIDGNFYKATINGDGTVTVGKQQSDLVDSSKITKVTGDFTGMTANDLSFGDGTSAYGGNATAFGEENTAAGRSSTAFGRNNIASGVNSLAFGGTTFTDKKGNQYQTQNVASGAASVAFGEGSQALALGSVAFGNGTQAGIKSDDGTAGQNSVAFGGSTKATGGRSLAFGERTNAEQTNSVAFGLETKSMSAGSTAFGNRTRAIAEYATAMGNSSVAAGVNSVAFGTDTMAGAKIDEHGAIALQNGQKIDSNGYVAYVNNGKTYSVTYQRLNKGKRSGEIHDYVVLAGNDGKQYIRDYHGDIHEVTIGQDDKITVIDKALTDSVLQKPGDGGYYSAGYKIDGYQNSTAFGSKTKATNNQATAFGTETVASGENSTAFGENSVASGKNSVSFGTSSKAYGENSLAGLGGTTGSLDDANKNGKNSIALGSGSLASHADTIAIGTEAKSDNDETTAVGNHVQATEKYAVAIGRNMVARGQAATAIGTSTHTEYGEENLFGAKANWATVVGVNNNATAERATAIGDTNEAAGGRSTALGSSNHAYTENSLAVGTYSTAGKANATNNEGMSSVAVGVYADASGKGSTALGSGYTGNHTKDNNGNETTDWEYIPTEASGDYSLALGNQAKATAANTAAMGYKAQATIADGVAIGSESKTNVDKDQSGYDVTTKLASTNGDATWKATRAAVSVGDVTYDAKGALDTTKTNVTRQITGVAAGFNDTDAVNVAQLKQLDSKVDTVSGQHTEVTVNGGTSAPDDETYTTGNLKLKLTNTDGKKVYDLKLADELSIGKKGTDGADGKIGVDGKNGFGVVINGSDGSIGLRGADGANGTPGKTIIVKGQDGKDGSKGVDGSTVDRIVINNTEVATMSDGLKFGANAPAAENGANPVANKLNTTVEVKGAGNKTLDNYSGKNLYTTVSQDGDGKTTIHILMDKDISGSSVTAGERGKNGTDGKDGKDGVDGSITIINGKPGTNGTDGLNGKDGKNASSEIHTHYGLVSLNDDKNVELEDGSKAMTRIHYVDQAGKDHEVATMDDGLYFTGNNTDKSNKHYLNSTVKVQGEGVTAEQTGQFQSARGNVAVVADGNDTLTIRLNKDLNLGNTGSVTMGNTVINNGGMTITKIDNGKTIKVSLTDGGLNNGGNKITNVANGTGNNDAVNVSQLKAAKTEVQAADNSVTVTKNTTPTTDGHDIYYVKANLAALGGMSGFNVAGNGQQTAKIKNGNTVDFKNGKNTTAVTTAKTDGSGVDVTYNLADDITLGKNGTDGVDGKIGVNGKDGSAVVINGKDGSIGLNGANGANGVSIKGDKGADGTTRVVYETKDGTETVRHEIATLDDGLKFGANAATAANGANPVANKLNTTVEIKGAGTKTVDNYSGENLYTTVSQDGNGKTTINVLMDKNLKSSSVTVGTDGAPGKDGVDGKVIIKNGKNGKDGADAGIHVIKGADGVNGTNGEDGITRIVYNDGKDGKNGTDHVVATLDDGMKYAGDNGQGAENAANIIKKKLNEQLDIVGGADPKKLTDNNIGVNATTDGKLKVQLAQDLTGLNSIISNTYYAGDKTSNNYTTITGDGITIKNGDDNHKDISITSTNINMGGQQIHNVAAGTELTDAVNVSQLNEAKSLAGKHSEVTVEGGTSAGNTDYTGNNLKLKVSTAKDGHKVYDLETG